MAAVTNLGQGAREQLSQPQAAAALALEQGKGHPLGRFGPHPRQHLQGFHHLIEQGTELHNTPYTGLPLATTWATTGQQNGITPLAQDYTRARLSLPFALLTKANATRMQRH